MLPAQIDDRYRRTLLAWLLGVAVPPIGLTLLLILAVSAHCGPDSVDCSWGLEVFVILPLLALCLLTVGPLAVYVSLRSVKDPLAAQTVGWALVLVLPSVPIVLVTAGLVLFVLPPIGGRYLALRRAQPVEIPTV